MGEEIFIKLRYCFQGGYTLPQYCVEQGIKKPLFVIERNAKCFLLEVHAQFRYDKRVLSGQFCFIDGGEEPEKIGFGQRILGTHITVKHISQIAISQFDAVIFLTPKNYPVNAKRIILFSDLEKFFIQRTYVDIPILHFLQRFPKVKFFLTNFPSAVGRYEGGIKFGKQLPPAGKLQQALANNKGKHIKNPFDKLGYSNEEAVELLRIDRVKGNLDGTSSLNDDHHPLKQIVNGKRLTAYQPEHFQNRIYFFGACYFFGRNAPYDRTIESYLQQMLNENNLPYRVENEGQAFSERSQDMFYNLNALDLKPGDIVFFYVWGMHSNDEVIPFFDISDAFDPPQNYREIFCTRSHVNEIGYKLVAEKYFKFLTANNFFREVEYKYPPPVNLTSTVMVYHRNSRRAA